MNAQTDFAARSPATALEPPPVLRLPLVQGDSTGCLDLLELAQLRYRVNASVPSATIELRVAGALVWQGEIVSVSTALADADPGAVGDRAEPALATAWREAQGLARDPDTFRLCRA